MSDPYKKMLEGMMVNILTAIRNDQLIKVMALEETSEAFILQRATQIIDAIYSAEREKLIISLSQELRMLKQRSSFGSQDQSASLRLKQEISDLNNRISKLNFQLQSKNSEIDQLQRRLRESQMSQSGSKELQMIRRENSSLKDRIADLQRQLSKSKSNSASCEDLLNKCRGLQNQLSGLRRQKGQQQRLMRQQQGQLQGIRRKLKRLEQQKKRAEDQSRRLIQESRSRVIPQTSQAREIQLIKLRDRVNQKKEKIRDLKEQLKRMSIEKQDLAACIKQFQRKLKQQAVNYQNTVKGLQAAHHDIQVRMRKDHQIKMQQLDLYHKRQHKILIQNNQDALEEMTRIHREQLQRNRRQADNQLKALTQRAEFLQKRNRQLQAVIQDSKKRIQSSKHPRFSIDQIARLQEELALKDTSILTVQNQRNALSAQLQRTLSERNFLLGQLQASRTQQMSTREELDRTRVESIGLDQLRQSKSHQIQSSLQNQIYFLVGQNQKLANQLKLLEAKLKDTVDYNINLGLKEKILTQNQMGLQSEFNKVSEINNQLSKLNLSQSARIKDLQSQVSPLPVLHDRINTLQNLQSRVYQLQRQRSQVLQRNQILKLDFDEITRQLRESHSNCLRLTQQRDKLKVELSRAGSLVDYSRDVASRNYQDMQKKRQLYVAQMQRTVNQLRNNFSAEQEALIGSFNEYQTRARKQIKELSDFICSKYEFMLESRDLSSQRQREALMTQYESENRNKLRNLQANYQIRERQILHQFEKARQLHEMEKNQLIRNFEFELERQPTVLPTQTVHEDLESSGSRAYLEGVLKNLRREIDSNRRALGAYR